MRESKRVPSVCNGRYGVCVLAASGDRLWIDLPTNVFFQTRVGIHVQYSLGVSSSVALGRALRQGCDGLPVHCEL